MMRRWSLRTRFVAAASLCLLPLLAVVLYVLDQSLDQSRDQIIETETAMSRVVAQGINQALIENQEVLTGLASTEAIRSLKPDAAKRELAQWSRARPNMYGLSLISPNTEVVASAGVELSPLPPTSVQALDAALQVGETGVSGMVMVPEADTEAITMFVPVEAEPGDETEGQAIGAVGSLLSVERLKRTFSPAMGLGSGDTFIAVVANNQIIAQQRGPDASADSTNVDISKPLIAAAGAKSGRMTYTDSSGAERLAVYTPVDFPGANWTVIVTNPAPTAYGENRYLLERGLLALTGAILLTLILAVLFGEFTARPLRQLTKQSAAIADGDYSQVVQPVGRGEVATLSSSFGLMAERLTSQVRDLEAARAEVELQAERLRDLLRRTVRLQEDERRRIASDIHDAVSPLITGALYQARAVRLTSNGNGNGHSDGKHDNESLNAITDLLERAMAEIHDVIFALRPPDLDDLGVVAAIDRYVQQINRTGLPCRLEVVGEQHRLSPEARLGIYRIVQEALHNALRHADADEAVVRLEWGEDLLRVTIRDNGSGFDPEQEARPASLGLLSMRERAAAIGARLEIASRPGDGTVVILERPVSGDLPAELEEGEEALQLALDELPAITEETESVAEPEVRSA
jgi:two-component system, NarL family, sensor histidine kinase DegS